MTAVNEPVKICHAAATAFAMMGLACARRAGASLIVARVCALVVGTTAVAVVTARVRVIGAGEGEPALGQSAHWMTMGASVAAGACATTTRAAAIAAIRARFVGSRSAPATAPPTAAVSTLSAPVAPAGRARSVSFAPVLRAVRLTGTATTERASAKTAGWVRRVPTAPALWGSSHW